mmetsp:Transcript_16640/g.45026  ORF Transcript_16640/g.45026 Transcript_16640/m.45026 type:complete len:206 (-) Transcript_16640:132-749(-)
MTGSGGGGGFQGYLRNSAATRRSAASDARPCRRSGRWLRPGPPAAVKSVRKRRPELTKQWSRGMEASASRKAPSVLQGRCAKYGPRDTSAPPVGGQSPTRMPVAQSRSAVTGLSAGTSKMAHLHQRHGPEALAPPSMSKASSLTGPLSKSGAPVRRCASTQTRSSKREAAPQERCTSPMIPGRTRSAAAVDANPTDKSLTSFATS